MDRANPLEEYLTEKKATSFAAGLRSGLPHNAGAFGQMMGKGLAHGAAAGAAAGVVAGGTVAVQKLYDAATKARDFKAMLEHNPDLLQKQEEDPKRFNQSFTTLRTFNPAFSKDPLVAGSVMREMMESPMSAAAQMMNVLPSREKMKSQFEEVPKAMYAGSKPKSERR